MNPAETSLKIVIVEDNASLAEIYKTRLELLGYKCFVAHEGLEALSLIEKERPSLVLLDIMIPKLAGDQVLQIMRSTSWGQDIKVLVISNLNEADAPPGLREAGIEGYAVKANLTNDQVDALVDKILKPADQKEDINLDSGPAPGAEVRLLNLPKATFRSRRGNWDFCRLTRRHIQRREHSILKAYPSRPG
jgi:DNA-binding response OmpR family regulator